MKTKKELELEIEMINAEKRKYHLEHYAMKLDRDNYKEDSEKRIKEVKIYYDEYNRVRDMLSKERDRTRALEEQIYSLGIVPVPEEDDENEQTTDDMRIIEELETKIELLPK